MPTGAPTIVQWLSSRLAGVGVASDSCPQLEAGGSG